MLLHSVGAACYVVHSGASEAQNIDALFFLLGWDWYGFHKKRTEACYTKLVFLHPVGSAGHVLHSCIWGAKRRHTIFPSRVGQVWFPLKAYWDTL
jgi:hypothetical protein